MAKRCVHRDIKPKNVLLDVDRKVGFLADFGSAAALDSTSGDAAAVRTTALYQAPEAARTGRVGPAADVYALGLTAFEMLNGLFPYGSLDAAEVDKRINQGQRALPARMLAPGAFAPHVPKAVRQLVRRMIDIDPARRPTSSDLVRALRALTYIDWRHDVGDGVDGEWSGRWPPRRCPGGLGTPFRRRVALWRRSSPGLRPPRAAPHRDPRRQRQARQHHRLLVPPGIAGQAPALGESQPLPAGTLAYIAESTGTRAARADEDHAAAPAGDDTAAAALGISPGSPVLIARIRYYAADGKPRATTANGPARGST